MDKLIIIDGWLPGSEARAGMQGTEGPQAEGSCTSEGHPVEEEALAQSTGGQPHRSPQQQQQQPQQQPALHNQPASHSNTTRCSIL